MSDDLPTQQPITRFQIFALLALACLNMQDGYDILAISFAANAITRDWGLSNSSLGLVLSASLFGMMLGAMALSPLADRIGRKYVAILGLVLSGIGMIMTAIAGSVDVLLVGRATTGIGVGAILVSLNTLVAEFAGERYRGAAVAIFQLGFPMGAFLSGFAVAWLIDLGDWRYVFAFGAFTSFIFVPVVMALPESMQFLAQSGRPDALATINQTRAKLRRPPLAALPSVAVTAAPSTSAWQQVRALFARQYIARTLLIWLSFFLLLSTLYFALSWTPHILVQLGFSEESGNQAGRLINLVGMPGIAIIGLTSTFVRPSLITTFYLAVLSALLIGLGAYNHTLTGLMVLISGIGFVMHGSMIGLYATAPALYPPHIRATGMGWAIGLSRFGAVLGPALAGYLLDAGWTVQQLFQGFAFPALVAALAVFLLWMEERSAASAL